MIALQTKVEELAAAVQALAASENKRSTTVKTRTKARLLEFEIEHVEVTPWDDHDPIHITTEQIKQAFDENPILQEYASFRNTELTDPKKAPPYVLEVLMDLLRRGHERPESRNIHLNPARSDQVKVKSAESSWEVRELSVAGRHLLSAVSRAMKRSTLSDAERQALELDVQDALAYAWQLYEGSPAEYVQKAQKPLAAHLANFTPQKSTRRILELGPTTEVGP